MSLISDRSVCVRVADPADPAAISAALPGVSVQVVNGLVEVASGVGRCFAHPGQWVVMKEATGALQALDRLHSWREGMR